jgi:magnesium chelatase family protein
MLRSFVPGMTIVGLPDTAVQESRERVQAARQVQRDRFAESDLTCNADMRPGDIREYCQLDDAGRALVKSAMVQLQLSARAYHRILKLARTIADLAGSEEIRPAHLAEALQYRPRNLVEG